MTRWDGSGRRRAYVVLAGVMLLAHGVQVFLAGYGLLADDRAWAWHRHFVALPELLPIALAVLAAVGKAPRRLIWLPVAMFGLVWLQYFLIQAPVGLLRALHPANAVVLTAMAVVTLLEARNTKETTP